MNDLKFNPATWHLQFIEEPFQLYRLSNVYSCEQDVLDLEKELNNLEFTHKMSDLFSFSQTNDLYSTETKLSPLLSKFVKFLEYFRMFLSKMYNISLDSNAISLTSSKYSVGDFLLCHDDKSEDRHIAFIFYLNSDWKPEWGGSLDIFDHDENESPSNIIYRVYPEFNSLIFFEVSNKSYHQVAEVVSKQASRITINGWFHSTEALKLKSMNSSESPIAFVDAHDSEETSFLDQWANNEFLQEKYTELIVENIKENGVMMLQDFLKSPMVEKISTELNSNFILWKRKGPANRRWYKVADLKTLPTLVASLVTIFQSKSMCSYLESITGYKLYKKSKGNLYTSGVYAELQLWQNGDYSVLSDDDVNFKNTTLDVFLFFNVISDTNVISDNNSDSLPGNIYYCKKNSVGIKFEVEPKNNSICLVHKKRNETSFVSYINHQSTITYNVLRVSYKL